MDAHRRLWLHSEAEDSWSAIDCHDRWISFDGREFHLTEDWDGPERYSLVYFTNPLWRRAKKNKAGRRTRDQLLDLGFNWPEEDGDEFGTSMVPERERRAAAIASMPDCISQAYRRSSSDPELATHASLEEAAARP